MGSILRRVAIGLISLAAVLVIYLLYTRFGGTPAIDTESGQDFADVITDSNLMVSDANVGKIGEVGIGNVMGGEYYHRNQYKQIDRKFGFKKLLHKVRDHWEIEKPYMYVYQRNFDCSITADLGSVEIETVASRPSPRDASFNGNVVIRISPKDAESDIGEGIIYLDDVVFVSDRSLFSTAGPVRFVAKDAEMLGVGLEMIYDDDAERLEFFRIIDLDSLRVSSAKASLTSVASDKSETGGPDTVVEAGAAVTEAAAEDGAYYKCIFSDNVQIDTAEQLIVARQMVVINDIFWAKSSADEPNDANTVAGEVVVDANAVAEQVDPNLGEAAGIEVVITCDGGVLLVPADSTRAAAAEARAAAIEVDPNEIISPDTVPERTTFTTPRIDYSIATEDSIAAGPTQLVFLIRDANAADPNKDMFPLTVTAMKHTKFLSKSNQVIFEGDCTVVIPPRDPNAEHDYVLSSPTITVNLLESESADPFSTADIVAAGPVNFDFWTDALDANNVGAAALPVSVIAKRHARFLSATRQIVFEGSCRCTMTDEDPNLMEQFILSAPRLTIDMPKDVNGESAGLAANFKNIRADGGIVRLATVKTAKAGSVLAMSMGSGDEDISLGGVELKCSRFDYDPNASLVTATGPGSMRFDNTRIPDPNGDSAGLSLRKPCYAIVQNFSTLKYYLNENRIVADAASDGSLLIDYFPISKGKYGQHVVAEAKHVEAYTYKTPEGQIELSALKATGGITYNDDTNEFIGSELFYDHEKSLLIVKGDSYQPCYLNGALVKGIKYDMATGKASGEVAAPGAFQFK